MSIVAIAIAAGAGLLIGSFLNVVIWRVPRGESVVRPRSHCPACEHELAAVENIPVVSWLAQHGRCRHCAARISLRYPAVEMLCAVLFAGMTWHFGVHAPLAAFLYLAAVGLALALIDLDVRRLPNALTLPSYGVAAALLTLSAFVDHEPGRLIRAAIGMASLYVFYFLLAVLKPGAMGFGDVKLAGVLGIYLGYLGWSALVVGAFAAFLLGGVVGVALMTMRRAGRKTRIPFGPYMIVGAFVGIFAGAQLAHWYLHATIG